MIISPETLRIMEVISTFVITLGVVAVIATVICLFLADLNKKSNLSKTLKAFIKNYDLSKFKILTKSYPKRSHADLQLAINEFLVNKSFQIMGIEKEYSRDRASISNLLAFDMEGLKSIKANYTDYDFPDDLVIKAIQNGVYLVTTTSSKLLILVKESESYYNDDVIIEIATINDSCGEILLQEFKQEISLSLTSKSIYRGRSLLLNQEGKIDFICHKEVESKEVILPEHTKIVIDRQIIDFSNRLLDFTHYQQSSKKGVLLYGPPGTGKTHLISYIKTQLKNHTLLVINSENITMISGVFKMANLLQPSLVIIEDVDLLAKSRDLEAGPYSDMMLQSLMNELDGISEKSDLCTILTTNRPKVLEEALISRPGRIDLSLHLGLPNQEEREKLFILYLGDQLKTSKDLLLEIVKRTHNTSAAFIKEICRRALHEMLFDDLKDLNLQHFTRSLDELFSSNSHLQKLLLEL